MLSLLSVDEILLLEYVNLFTHFRGQPLKMNMSPSRFKGMNYILFFTQRRIFLLFALAYTVGYQIGQVFLREISAGYHLLLAFLYKPMFSLNLLTLRVHGLGRL